MPEEKNKRKSSKKGERKWDIMWPGRSRKKYDSKTGGERKRIYICRYRSNV